LAGNDKTAVGYRFMTLYKKRCNFRAYHERTKQNTIVREFAGAPVKT
jgi:hypothetical protein